jgi:hypothetical protein
MSTIEAPPSGPIDFEAWYKLGEDEKRGSEDQPVDHLIGKCVLEERVDEAEERWLKGQSLTQVEHNLLTLTGEYVDYEDYDE